jgi:hypothetical protein
MHRAVVMALMAGLVATPAAGQGALAWRQASNGEGYGMILATPGGEPVFSLACVRGTSAILAIAYAVRPQTGRQEFLLRIGERRFTFVVKPEAMKDGKMVQATAKASPELLASIRSAKAISASYGATRLGPYPGPAGALATTFAQRCGPLI